MVALADRRISWPAVIERAKEIVGSYDTGVTLRQCFYRLYAEGLVQNPKSFYSYLSRLTADARRDGSFPAFIDMGREIHRRPTWTSPKEILQIAYDDYRRDRTEGQPVSLYIGVEKHGQVTLLDRWFGDLGIPILSLHGYSSATYDGDIMADFKRHDRKNVLLYAGDLDPAGEDILRNLEDKVSGFHHVVQVALTIQQAKRYKLPVWPKTFKKNKDGDATGNGVAAFEKKYGRLFQIEMDAIEPNELRRLFQEQIDRYWDKSEYEKVLRREKREKATLKPK